MGKNNLPKMSHLDHLEHSVYLKPYNELKQQQKGRVSFLKIIIPICIFLKDVGQLYIQCLSLFLP